MCHGRALCTRSARRGQKQELNLLELELKAVSSWEPTPGPLKEQSTLLTAEPSLQRFELSWIMLPVEASRANTHDAEGWLY